MCQQPNHVNKNRGQKLMEIKGRNSSEMDFNASQFNSSEE